MGLQHSAKPLPSALTIGLAALAAALALWAAQAAPMLHIARPALTVSECALLITAWTGLQIATIQPRYRWVEEVLVIWLAQRAGPPPPHTCYDDVIGRRSVYTVCGIIAVAAGLAVVCVDTLLAIGLIELRGANLLLTNAVLMGAAAQLATTRLLGPQAAAFQAARMQAEVAASSVDDHEIPGDLSGLGSGEWSRHHTR